MKNSAYFTLFCAIAMVTPSARANEGSKDLVRQGRIHEACSELTSALRSYTDALSLDPTSADAYLGLARVRLNLGEPREAEVVYSTALAHVPNLNEALIGRAHARRALHANALADRDLADYAKLTVGIDAWKELARWYGEEGRFTAELSVWRELLELAETHSDAALETLAKSELRALVILSKPTDAAAYPATDDFTRDVLARIARRGG